MMVRKVLLALIFVLASPLLTLADTDGYISDLNIYASKSFAKYKTEISARYGLSGSRFDLMLKKVDSPGDLAVALWIGYRSQTSVDDVIKKARLHRGSGWGVIAQEMGIKPGSPDFKTLKAGKIDWRPKDFDAVVKKEDKEKEEAAKESERERKKREAIERKEMKRQEREKNKEK